MIMNKIQLSWWSKQDLFINETIFSNFCSLLYQTAMVIKLIGNVGPVVVKREIQN